MLDQVIAEPNHTAEPPPAPPVATLGELGQRLSRLEGQVASLRRWVLGIVVGSELLRGLGLTKETLVRLFTVLGGGG